MHNYDCFAPFSRCVFVAGSSNKSDNDIQIPIYMGGTTKDTQAATTHEATWNLE